MYRSDGTYVVDVMGKVMALIASVVETLLNKEIYT